MNATSKAASSEIPRGNFEGFFKYFNSDLIAGFLVFLIALPLCLGIAKASGYPPVAGIFTAIIGSIVTSLISNSELTIKGPAAGLILVVMPAVSSFGYVGDGGPADFQAYRMALAVGVAAGICQILFGIFRAGVLGDFFPTTAVHGMLAAIGVIIMIKQFPLTFGETNKGEPLEVLSEIPHKLTHANPEILAIGVVSLLILFLKPLIKAKWVKMIPSQLVVLLVAVPLGVYFGLTEDHTYSFMGHDYFISQKNFLVDVPNSLLSAVTYPDFSALTKPIAWKWVLMFTLIGSLESILSAKAVDMVDPWKRRANLDRDLLAVGIANTLVSLVGGLPMISEIVRSKANIDNGAKTRFSDMWHGIFLLGFVSLIPWALHRIPMSALAAMLVFTGFRLASPKEFYNVFQIGREQLLIFIATIAGVLYTADLLGGLAIGILVKFTIHAINGVPLASFFKAFLVVEDIDDKTSVIRASQSAVFSNWFLFKRQIEQLGRIQQRNVIVDLSDTKLVDHSVMEKLHELEDDFAQDGLKLEVIGLDAHRQLSDHKFSTRRRALSRLRRITAVADATLEDALVRRFIELGASGYTVIPCHGMGRKGIGDSLNGSRIDKSSTPEAQIRLEVVVPEEVANRIVDFVRQELLRMHRATVVVEIVEAVKADQF
jgi:MFS superfamily sulfate permease-like transporter